MLLKGKKGLVVGVANDRSMAWGIAKLAHEHGAELAFNYTRDFMEKRVRPLAESVNSPIIEKMNVQDDQQLDNLFAKIEEKWGKLDFLIHAVAFSDKDELRGRFVDITSRENFKNTMDVSAYSLVDLSRRAMPLMKDGGSIITLTYIGGEVVTPGYNMMGVAKSALDCSTKYLAADMGEQNIRVNAISAGPIRTLASAGVGDFGTMSAWAKVNSPLRRNMTMDDVAGSALYLLSDLSSGVTGEIHHVDCGYSILGTPHAKVMKQLQPSMPDLVKDLD
ncbi:MAG: enoyl-ACP reductase [Alphaproteobacteria bacterium]|nr:enoyl-ACP reductase [Alphaproteobacteria bacterium]MBL0718104.1 enoyl-ACP reductase [Alphaproteobacteria bacterium]